MNKETKLVQLESQLHLEREREKAQGKYEPEKAGECNATWGHCTPIPGLNFGKPSATPHRCNGAPGHISKLHRCECGSYGHRIVPTKLSKAGREVSSILAAVEKAKAVKEEVEP